MRAKKKTPKGCIELSFYQFLTQYYDDIFPLEPQKITFLDNEFQKAGVRRILDLACGSGSYTIGLARLGYDAWGTDLEKDMIALAKEKAATLNAAAHFVVGDMRAPAELGIQFDGLFCIGNSLAHLALC